ncbi:MAG: cytochrome c maturation protein CcmE [Candidatus Acidiferrales bacterium]
MSGGKTKFVIGSLIIVGVLAWLGISGYQESKSYYVTLPELRAQGEEAYTRRLRVAGDVLPGSIRRQEGKVLFAIHQGSDQLPVTYVGRDPVPDTLVDNAQAIVTGHYGRDNVFVAEQVQAKCASKYEALPPGVQPKPASPTASAAPTN